MIDLAIAPSAVSQAVAQLETALGITLLSRTTRSVHLTEAGQKLLTELAPALGNIDAALQTVQDMRTQPAGTVKVSTPRSAAHIFLAPKFKNFGEAYPDIILDIHIEDQFVDIVAAGFDAGIDPRYKIYLQHLRCPHQDRRQNRHPAKSFQM